MAAVTMEQYGNNIANALCEYGIFTNLINCTETPSTYRFDFSGGDYRNITLKAAMERLNNRNGLTYEKRNNGGFTVVKVKTEREFVNYYQTNAPIRQAIAQDLNGKQKCYLCFGKGAEWITTNMDKCKHILIAGMTGSGKSCLLNSLISQLYQFSDAYLRLIDPKGGVELGLYENYNRNTCAKHERVKVSKDTHSAIAMLKSAVATMEARYKVMGNAKNYSGKRFIVVIDELADLMMTSKAEVEEYIIRIAQKGRAAGVHLIVATQDPRVQVVTGLIKNNLPTVICLKTKNARHSMNVIDIGQGAQLLDNGDALVQLPYSTALTRCQCPYITDNEIRHIISKRTV